MGRGHASVLCSLLTCEVKKGGHLAGFVFHLEGVVVFAIQVMGVTGNYG